MPGIGGLNFNFELFLLHIYCLFLSESFFFVLVYKLGKVMVMNLYFRTILLMNLILQNLLK